MANLITLADIQAYRPVTSNIPAGRIDPFIAEAQDLDLRPLLGDSLYYQVIGDTSGYADLISGVDYTNDDDVTIPFAGLKPVLVYFALARFMVHNSDTTTVFGEVRKTNEFSSPTPEGALAHKINQLKSIARAKWEDVVKYLNEHDDETIYDNWTNTCSNKSGPNTIHISAVGGNEGSYKSRCTCDSDIHCTCGYIRRVF